MISKKKRRAVRGRMLSGLHDFMEETSGVVCEFMVHGPKEDVLHLVYLLRDTERVREIPLRSDYSSPHPYAGFLKALSIKVTGEAKLLMERAGTTLEIKGARQSMEALAEDIHHAARMIGKTTGSHLVDDVIVETVDEPYMDARSKHLSTEIYQPT